MIRLNAEGNMAKEISKLADKVFQEKKIIIIFHLNAHKIMKDLKLTYLV